MIRRSVLLLALELLVIAPTYAVDPSSAGAVNETLQLAETILEHHVLPPTRQEMLLSALRTAFRESRTPSPLDLSRRFSDAASTDELRVIMLEELDVLLARGLIREHKLAGTLREGLFAVVPGHIALAAAENERVNAQFRSNRYTGTGIALSIDNGVPTMQQVIPGGPAESVGALDGDHIEDIDGESTTGMTIQRVIELLRGPEGTDVTVALRQPDEDQPRVVTITRGVVPLQTISAYELFSAGEDGVVAYLRIDRLSASCIHELRTYGDRLRRDGVHGLILDLRFASPGDVHHTVLLADALLDGADIGRVRTHAGDRDYVAEPGELFPDLKLGVLVARSSRGTVEWLAAALQDAGRAVIFGDWTPGEAFASEAMATRRDDQMLILPTALLERAGGRNLLRPAADERTGDPSEPFVRSDIHISPQAAPWGVLPDVPLPARTGEELLAMPAAAARRLLNPPRSPRGRNSLRRNNTGSERSPADD